MTDKLSQIEQKVLVMVIDGKTNYEIADVLGYSESHTKRIVKRLFLYYKVAKRLDLVREALFCQGYKLKDDTQGSQ